MKHRVLGVILATTLMLLWVQTGHPAYSAEDNYVADHSDVAREYMGSQQWTYASFEWRNVLDKDPNNLEANIGLAQALIETGYPDDAIAHLEKVRETNPSPQLGTALAKLYIRTQAYAKAAQTYQSMLRANPSDSVTFRMLQNVSPKLSAENRARVTRFLTEQAEIAKRQGLQAIQAKKYADAAQHYAIVAIVNPKVKDLNDYGLALLLSGEPKLASDQFIRVYKNVKAPWQSLANMAVVATALNRIDTAERFIQEAIAKCPTALMKAKLYNIWGYAQEMQRNMTRAQFAYGKAVELDPTLTKARLNLGYVLQRDRQFTKAAQVFQDVIKLEPTNGEAWNQLGFTWELARQYKQAESAYRKAIEIAPTQRDGYFNLGTLYKKQGDIEKATEVFKKLNEQEFAQVESGKPLSKNTDSAAVELTSLIDVFFMETPSTVPSTTPVVRRPAVKRPLNSTLKPLPEKVTQP